MSAPYFIPRTRAQLVDWLARQWPQDRAKLARMPRRQLYAVFYAQLRRLRPEACQQPAR